MRISISGTGSNSNSRFGADTAIASPSTSSTAATPASNESTEIKPGSPIELLTLKVEKSGDPNTRDEIKIWLEDANQSLTLPAGSSPR